MTVGQIIPAIIGFGIVAAPVIGCIFAVAWIKDIRSDTQKIREILKKRFPEDFQDEE